MNTKQHTLQQHPWLIIATLILAILACGNNPPTVIIDTDFETGEVVKVVDGDTIDVLIDGDKYRVRYILIDTPETERSPGGAEPYGAEASAANKRLVEGKTVQLEKDVSETDRFDRLLRYVYVDGVLVNEELLRLGLARVVKFPPDLKYLDRFSEVEQEAQEGGLGIWGD